MSVRVAKEWITKAKNDAKAAVFSKEISIENSCFHAQQAIEKTLKAAVIFDNKEIIHTHDLKKLADALVPKWNIKRFSCDWDKISGNYSPPLFFF